MNLKSMSIDQLVALREQVSETLGARVTDQRRALEAELSKLTRFQAGSASSKSGSRRGAKAPVAPKYRNPENPSETWAGRGLRPRWLSAAIKMGKKVDDFLISQRGDTPAEGYSPQKDGESCNVAEALKADRRRFGKNAGACGVPCVFWIGYAAPRSTKMDQSGAIHHGVGFILWVVWLIRNGRAASSSTRHVISAESKTEGAIPSFVRTCRTVGGDTGWLDQRFLSSNQIERSFGLCSSASLRSWQMICFKELVV